MDTVSRIAHNVLVSRIVGVTALIAKDGTMQPPTAGVRLHLSNGDKDVAYLISPGESIPEEGQFLCVDGKVSFAVTVAQFSAMFSIPAEE